MITEETTSVPQVVLGRSGITSTRLGLGCSIWPLKIPYQQVLDNLRTALDLGIRHIDVAPLYGTEEIVGRALHDLGIPKDLVLATKACAYLGELGILYREYSGATVYESVERSLQRLRVDCLDIVHLHDVEPEDLPHILSEKGALRALLDLKARGVVRSIGMATQSLVALQAAIDTNEFDHIQAYHSCTLLNQDLMQSVCPGARKKNLSILNNAPFAGFILATGPVPGARYNYRPAERPVTEAARRVEEVCTRKGVSLEMAALAFSLKNPEIDVTVVGASTPEKLRRRVEALQAPLGMDDFVEMILAAGGSFPISSPFAGKNPYKDDRGL